MLSLLSMPCGPAVCFSRKSMFSGSRFISGGYPELDGGQKNELLLSNIGLRNFDTPVPSQYIYCFWWGY